MLTPCRRVVALVLSTVGAVTVAACGGDTQVASPRSTVSVDTSGSSQVSTPTAPSPAATSSCVAQTVRSMSVPDKLAAMLVVGVSGPDDAAAVVREHHVGGIFVGSFTDKSILTDGRLAAIRASSPRPLMVTVDQEGGRVSRLRSFGIDSPTARDLAATRTPAQVRRLGFTTGQKLLRLGITVDFAPVADVSDEPADEVIGDRSFSDDPAVVATYAAAYAAGLREAGVMPVFKHFPGHGHGSGDSHTGTVRTPPLAQLVTDDLVPYRSLLRDTAARADRPGVGVMVGHLIVPGLTGPDTPASISPAAMRLLRTGVGYRGVGFDGPVFTDDLSGMAAISARYGVPEAVVRAVSAGADLALWLSTEQVPPVLAALSAAVRSKRLPMAQVDASVARTLNAQGARC
ncbi:glycoside hydrolase family 3 N-terminal domain-containing protein [Williamsia sp. CHRR-6]|uniref:glycoside hydrolase family 3 N-terminal domain-containing protein n=1 Tax=Williamsia sp. CHRR-6 TaxID=2835871 RepID=UPI001BDB4539|nr:glycoside hydrolase family 3 N-terminal domain-containing protein [Williamsia sp. CHRR-6]MBT0567470.1 glycoside hydrolase family 3 protein [Williamsia sp. CHRR-6]